MLLDDDKIRQAPSLLLPNKAEYEILKATESARVTLTDSGLEY